MTKKDYKLIASAIAIAITNKKEKEMLIGVLIPVLKRDNGRFDEEKFKITCEGRIE